MPKLLKGLMLIAVLLSASCSTVVKKSSNQSSSIDLESANSQIAVDLLSIYRQITIPFSTTIQVSSLDETDMVSAAVQEFVQAGYGIQRVSTDQGANLLKVMRKQPTDNKSLFRYTLNVGNIYISRLYDVLATEVIPASAFEISGSLVVAEIEDAHFESAYPEQYRTIIYTNFESEKQEPTTVSLYTDTTTSDATNVSSLGKNSSQLEITNLFNSESVFQSVTQSHDRLARQVLVFANDSLVMGDNNKLLVREFLKQYETQQDQIRLIGCSNGQTDLDMGNEGLALGRAARVTDELLRAGVPRDRVLDEGCWAPVSAGDRFPGRGVVIELWRRKS